jgi:hypothetical protein
VEALPGNVMAGAGGAGGLAPDVRHQPPGRTVYIYHNCESYSMNAASIEFNASRYSGRGARFESLVRQLFAFPEHVQRNKILYI